MLILLSGGLDSACCVHFFKSQNYDVEAVFVDFGQPSAEMERNAAAVICKHQNIKLNSVSAVTNQKFSTGELIGRNAFLINCALFLGGISKGSIAIGIHSGVPYYDCTETFVSRVNLLVQECTNGAVSVVAPFVHWTKNDLFNYFKQTKIPLDMVYSCEAGRAEPCLVCASCKDREGI